MTEGERFRDAGYRVVLRCGNETERQEAMARRWWLNDRFPPSRPYVRGVEPNQVAGLEPLSRWRARAA